MKITIALVDDQQLFLRSLSSLINTMEEFEVTMECLMAPDLLKKLAQAKEVPDIVLADVQMPEMDGPELVRKITAAYPSIRCVALSVKDDDMTILRMIRAGCCSYLLKDIHPLELAKALQEVYRKGYYNADIVNVNYRRLLLKNQSSDAALVTPREQEFLSLACSDLTYKEIASKMFLSEKTIDNYRESLFQKLNVRSRVGLALEALRRNLISLQ
jgi:DNA-binding NarL/FixJ family response regulator